MQMSRQTHIALGAAAICVGLIAAAAPAATVLVSPTVLNGGFETATLTGFPLAASYANTANWVNLGAGGQTPEFVRTDLELTTDKNALIYEGPDRKPALDTAYVLQAGDFIEFSYWWRDAFNWADGSDRIRFELYTTADDTITGVATLIAGFTSQLSAADSAYQMESGSHIVGAPHAGKRLFIAVGTIDGSGAANGFARLDDVTVSVTSAAIPAPAAIHAGLLLLGIVMAARRRHH